MENIYTVKESLIYNTFYVQLSLRIFINTSLSAVSDPQILKLNPKEHEV